MSDAASLRSSSCYVVAFTGVAIDTMSPVIGHVVKVGVIRNSGHETNGAFRIFAKEATDAL